MEASGNCGGAQVVVHRRGNFRPSSLQPRPKEVGWANSKTILLYFSSIQHVKILRPFTRNFFLPGGLIKEVSVSLSQNMCVVCVFFLKSHGPVTIKDMQSPHPHRSGGNFMKDAECAFFKLSRNLIEKWGEDVTK